MATTTLAGCVAAAVLNAAGNFIADSSGQGVNTTSANHLPWSLSAFYIDSVTTNPYIWLASTYDEAGSVAEVWKAGTCVGGFSTNDSSTSFAGGLVACNSKAAIYGATQTSGGVTVYGVFRGSIQGGVPLPYYGSKNILGTVTDAVITNPNSEVHLTSASGQLAGLIGHSAIGVYWWDGTTLHSNLGYPNSNTSAYDFRLSQPQAAGAISQTVYYGDLSNGFFQTSSTSAVVALSADENNYYVKHADGTIIALRWYDMVQVTLPGTYPTLVYSNGGTFDLAVRTMTDANGNVYTHTRLPFTLLTVKSSGGSPINAYVNVNRVTIPDLDTESGQVLTLQTPEQTIKYHRDTFESEYVGCTVDPTNHPNDFRLTIGNYTSCIIRNVSGHKLQFLTSMYAGGCAINRWNGSVFVPCGFISESPSVSQVSGWPSFSLGTHRFGYAYDGTNGNANPQDGTWTGVVGTIVNTAHIRGVSVDASGNITLSQSGGYVVLTLDHFTSAGVPVYTVGSPVTPSGVVATSDFGRCITDGGTTYYMGINSHGASLASSGNAGMAGNFIVATGTYNFTAEVPYSNDYYGQYSTQIINTGEANNNTGPNWPKGFAVAGPYLFVGYQTGSLIVVLDKTNGNYLGKLNPHSSYFADGTYFDCVIPFNSRLLGDGTTLILGENEYYANELLFQIPALTPSPTGGLLMLKGTGGLLVLKGA